MDKNQSNAAWLAVIAALTGAAAATMMPIRRLYESGKPNPVERKSKTPKKHRLTAARAKAKRIKKIAHRSRMRNALDR